MNEANDKPVLVTGGTGFLARHTILQLLAGGHAVRASVRSSDKAAHLRAILGAAGAALARFETVEADLGIPAHWPNALEGVDRVLHLATPMQGKAVTETAIEGTRLVVKASAAAGARRIVLTSSGLAALYPRRRVTAGVVSEDDWSDSANRRLNGYGRAKTLAEHAAWQLAREHGLALTTILPGAIIGPALGPDRSGWLALIAGMLDGRMAALPPMRLQMVDVRDLAALHVSALFAGEAEGKRYIAAGETLSLREVAGMLRDELGAVAGKVSTREMPGWMLRLSGLVNAQARQAVPLLAAVPTLSAARARRELQWVPRPLRASIGDTARSLLAPV